MWLADRGFTDAALTGRAERYAWLAGLRSTTAQPIRSTANAGARPPNTHVRLQPSAVSYLPRSPGGTLDNACIAATRRWSKITAPPGSH